MPCLRPPQGDVWPEASLSDKNQRGEEQIYICSTDERFSVHQVRHRGGRRRRQDLHAYLLHLQHFPHRELIFFLSFFAPFVRLGHLAYI